MIVIAALIMYCASESKSASSRACSIAIAPLKARSIRIHTHPTCLPLAKRASHRDFAKPKHQAWERFTGIKSSLGARGKKFLGVLGVLKLLDLTTDEPRAAEPLPNRERTDQPQRHEERKERDQISSLFALFVVQLVKTAQLEQDFLCKRRTLG